MNSLIGKIIADRYRVEEFLGRGGMSEVYKVWDKHRGTYLAMKLLHEDLAHDGIFLRRFRREANTLAKLQHPHIVRFYGLEQDGFLAFLLMDYVEGEDLKKEIFRYWGKGISPGRMVEFIKPVCSALGYAHRQGWIHCDVKPGNIMINKHGEVLLADFGIARMTDTATATMVGMGTPAYMAPEQVKGLDPVPQTDIYALGIILYEMLTGGERPFTGEAAEVTGTTSAKVRWEQANLVPPSPRIYYPDLSPALEQVVLRCLEKAPRDRYQTPLEVLNALERAVGGNAADDQRKRGVFKIESGQEPAQAPSPIPDSEAPTRLPPEPESQPSNLQPADLSTQSGWQRYGGWLTAGGLLVILLGVLFGGGIIPLKPAQTETPLPMRTASLASHPTGTETLVPSAFWTETPALTPTWTLTVTPSLTYTVTSLPTLDITRVVSPADGMVMVYIPAGEFEMGSEEGRSNESPVHTVYTDAFWMDEHEVTLEQYKTFLRETGYDDTPDGYGNDHPAVVNWWAAKAYCEWAGKRLSTEAEWEKAARGGLEGKRHPWGDEDPVCTSGAKNGAQSGSCGGYTVPVKTFAPNGYGLYDMAGNVWEWVADWYDGDYYGSSPTNNPEGPDSGEYRVLRGGSWFDSAYILRAAGRNRDAPFYPGNASHLSYGFRCARSP